MRTTIPPPAPQLAPLWPLPHVSLILSLYAMVRARRSKAWPGKICPLRIRMRVRGAPETPCASMPLPHASLIFSRYAMVSACRGKMWPGKIHSLRNFSEACSSTLVPLLAVTANHRLHHMALLCRHHSGGGIHGPCLCAQLCAQLVCSAVCNGFALVVVASFRFFHSVFHPISRAHTQLSYRPCLTAPCCRAAGESWRHRKSLRR